ncbi:hypothetical protein OKA05_21765 [Luteolibacter arcticus]|uniref:Uncharacterized protein n=1 Tax=Luteolibacter arcticus TaxID=1581411 RepID=A0ABT3GNX6_9BACT|nr:hypothetical protein [Luteolibacter arcticus]MCW1925202.1 hypothetical protein [Luteolibacter arcticus]
MQALAIIGLSILAAVLYGIVHDQITARICVEYFTIGHARLIDSDSPTVLGFFWGVVATWWVGLFLGIGLAIAARAGRRRKLMVKDLIPSLRKLLIAMFAVALIAGCIGYFGGKAGVFILIEELASRMPAYRHVAFLTCGWAHSASYLAGLVGGITLWIRTWRRRGAASAG